MVVLLVATLGLIAAAALAFWPSRDERSGTDRPGTDRPGTGRALTGRAEPVTSGEPAVPSTLEGVLARQLIAGEITRSQYLRAQEQVAARDEERHPMIVRWDAHP
ncbi:hypothetical protein [Actinoplanes subglobosus]|uniref:SHOCT domain-containing protein n=1 Tax=Actinoplanes subglobosus TaxID=1547892 RepID=A0ABV8J490_9ACTN